MTISGSQRERFLPAQKTWPVAAIAHVLSWNPLYNEQLFLVPWNFVVSGFHHVKVTNDDSPYIAFTSQCFTNKLKYLLEKGKWCPFGLRIWQLVRSSDLKFYSRYPFK